MIILEKPDDDQPHYHVAVSQVVFSEKKILKCILGSCVSVVLFPGIHRETFSSMSHYLLDYSENAIPLNNDTEDKFGNILVTKQIEGMTRRINKADLKAMIFGGSNIKGFSEQSRYSQIGTNNVLVAEKLLARMKIEVVFRNTGNDVSRFVEFNPVLKSVQVKNTQTGQMEFFSFLS